MTNKFIRDNYHTICDQLGSIDADLAAIIKTYGYPPFWSRPNTFETLVHIILEQQVSLASALSALNKLRERVQQLTPARLLLLTDEEMKACYCSRQKTSYIKYLAEALLSGQLNLAELEEMPDDQVRAKLVALKGIGNWTADVYLMFVLQHSDIFPVGDLAAVNAMKRVKHLPAGTTKEQLMKIATQWQPNKTIATMILWHYYLSAPKSKDLII
ncbi:DNA-3-methyladenine glycosylase 2 family protein [Mucilaginibacter sp. BJC16-A38]|uniref:DNA-3-methyladenine glycosylase family protein n=1 Tax=Mucilaginibacter phenanthrenivorans TaxID=1234842 RepID=UPI00215849A5|nr:DNA-3-methyladenine glycosylase 2 family protein [Mucilaginibacter phenanthrenivorans]MCR8559415.1 DNA-3-methyladenine glycosylase 2 family protein [Mucilaginibacter phenanthrenivorans]